MNLSDISLNVWATIIGSLIVGIILLALGVVVNYFKKINRNLEKIVVNQTTINVKVDNHHELIKDHKDWIQRVEVKADSALRLKRA